MSANLVAPTAAWESRRPPSALPLSGAVVQLPDGGWAIDDSGAAADGFITAAAGGGVQADDAAISGLNVRLLGTTPIVY